VAFVATAPVGRLFEKQSTTVSGDSPGGYTKLDTIDINNFALMISNLSWFDIVGFTGVLLIIIAYLLLQLDKLASSSPSYSVLNATGALLIIVSLIFDFNLSAFVVEAFWFLISGVGLWRSFSWRTASTMCNEPKDWPRVFERYLNAGNLDAVMALYESEARFVSRSGEILAGRRKIRDALANMIDTKTRFHSRVVKAVAVDDIAQLYTDFEGTMIDESGRTIATHHKAIEVLRRQPAGDWKLIIGDPDGRE
jgi:ketosteroid isomerase-like protein